MSPEAYAQLVTFDALSRKGREFYQHAAAVLPGRAQSERYLRVARAKAEVVALLALRLRVGGGEDRSRVRMEQAFGAGWKQAYALARPGLAAGDPRRLHEQLRTLERALAQACDDAIASTRDADCRRELRWLLPLLQRCLDELGSEAPPAMDS